MLGISAHAGSSLLARAARLRPPFRPLALSPLLLCAILASTAHAQRLDLPTRVDPPVLTESTHSAVVAAQLEVEMAHFDDVERGARNEAQRIIIRASISVRLVAAELLAAADAAGPEGSVAAVLGMTLAIGRADLDAMLTALAREIDRPAGQPGPVALDDLLRALEAIERFNDRVVEHANALRGAEPHRMDAALAEMFEPFATALAIVHGTAPQSHWPVARARDERGGVQAPTDSTALAAESVAASVERLAARVETTDLGPEAAVALERLLEHLRAGAEFAEFRAAADRLRRRVERVLELVEAVDRAGWAEPEWQSAWRDEAAALIRDLADPEARSAAMERAERLDRLRAFVAATSVLDNSGAPAKSIGRLLAAWTVDDPIAGAVAMDAHGPLLDVVIDRMIERRDRPPGELPRELRAIGQRLEQSYVRSEQDLLAELDRLGTPGTPMADPAFASLVAAHAEALENIERLETIPEWMDLAVGISPREGRAFAAVARRWGQHLGDPGRRAAAVEIMDAFAAAVERFVPMPFERELRAAEHHAVVVAGALQDDLVRRIDAAREQWIVEWTKGEQDGAGAMRLELYHRLATAMTESVEVVRVRDDASRLNGWSGWETPPGQLERATADLPNRLKLATASAVQDELEALAHQLDRIDAEMPVAGLVGRLALGVAEALPREPTGAHVIVGQLAYPPTDTTWMAADRARIAAICRYLVEASHARSEGRLDLAESIEAFVNDAAGRGR